MERKVVNNAFYDELKEKWYDSYDHPIALLRAENKARAPLVSKKIEEHFGGKPCSVMDIGCGGGFLSNCLAHHGHAVIGLDLSQESLEVAKKSDKTKRVTYLHGNAYDLPVQKETFDVVCAMDLLEHVEEPAQVISEAARILKPGGLFFFHTFNRSWMSWLIALKGMEWFVPNTPPNIHIYRLFITPQEMKTYLEKHLLCISEIFGLMPILNREFFKLIFQRKITQNFAFHKVPTLKCGYMGCAIKREH